MTLDEMIEIEQQEYARHASDMTVEEAIENALSLIEAHHGHRDGDIYMDLDLALTRIRSFPAVARVRLGMTDSVARSFVRRVND